MKRLILVFFFCCLLIIAVFLFFNDIETTLTIHLHSLTSKIVYALTSFILLVSDIVLPVPSSLIMILNGKILGIVPGTLISLLAGTLSSCIGFLIGRKASPILDKLFTQQEKEISNRFFYKSGNMAIIISKAIPIISEAVSVLSGTTSITFRTFVSWSIAGHLFVSIAYAGAGKFAGSAGSDWLTVIIIVATLLVAWVTRFFVRRRISSGPVCHFDEGEI